MAELSPKSLFAPVLHSTNLTYTLAQSADIEFFTDLFNSATDGEENNPFTVSSVRELLINTAPRPCETHGERSKDAAVYVVRLNSEKIGEINLTRRASNFPLDIGFAFLPQYRGRGYGSEAATRIMRYWKDEFGIGNICGLVSEENIASRKLLMKIGLEENGWAVVSGNREIVYSLPGIPKEEGREVSFWGEEPNEHEAIILD
ncbi:acyl-CoA N-acyltransferase [Talaromyces proteolyticus]|uniref:Acyl-CoA N-acyltransferase n=1 Tax=Talaromyces proteolyticus TaxID=1131652 RepID=A0AAD4PY25_9EURO|nr:acyl-CoA N-acyltransferase [Talaromyces proteolyticus]KAH8694180.1 acyl-CoA N-acyltransferase [Talaromyces proteolyticus]